MIHSGIGIGIGSMDALPEGGVFFCISADSQPFAYYGKIYYTPSM
jgi:hypothetical protein